MNWQFKNPFRRGCILILAAAMLSFACTGEGRSQQPKDAQGDPLPDGASARLGSIRWRHAGQAIFAAFLPDGKSVISADSDKTIRIWDYPAGKELRRIGPTIEKPVRSVGATSRFPTDFPVALSKDGKTVAASFDGSNIVLFDVATGKEIKTIQDGPLPARRRIYALAFSPTAPHLAILSLDGGGRVWDCDNAKEICKLLTGADNPAIFGSGVLAWSPDGKNLATIKDDIENNSVVETIEIRNPATGKKLHSFKLDNNGQVAFGLVFSRDSKSLAFATDSGQIMLLDAATGKNLRTWKKDPGDEVLLFEPDGTKLYVRSTRHKAILVWEVNGKALPTISLPASFPDIVRRIGFPSFRAAWSPDGKLMVLSGGGNAPLFVDVAAGREIGAGAADLYAVRFTPDGKHLWSRGGDGTVQKWDIATSRRLELPILAKLAWHGPISPDGKSLVASAADPKLGAFLDSATGKERGSFPFHLTKAQAPNQIYVASRLNRAMVFSPDGKMLAVRKFPDNYIVLYEAPAGKVLQLLRIAPVVPGAGGRPLGIAPAALFFSADSKAVAAFADPTTFAVWSTITGERVAELTPANPLLVNSGAFSPDGRCLVLESKDGTAVQYELATGRVRRTFGQAPPGKSPIRIGGPGPSPPIPEPRVAFGSQGQMFFHAGIDRTIRAWDVDTGKELAAFTGHLDSVEAIALSADGKTLASASADTTVLLWDLTRIERPLPALKFLARGERDARWQTLLDSDAAKAFAAICDLSAAPQDALVLLTEQLKPAPPLDMKRVEELLVALDSKQFSMREQAKAELVKIGERVVPALDHVCTGDVPLEYKRRLDEIRQQVAGKVLQGDRLRMVRALEILERIGTKDAGRLLQTLADGAPDALLTRTAQATQQRMK